MRQFVREQQSSLVGPRHEPTRAEHDVVSHRVCVGVHVLRRLFCGSPGVHAHPAEIVPEALLHILPQRRLKWPAGTGKRTVYAGRCRIRLPVRLSRKALDARRRSGDGGMRRLRHHLLGDAVCLLLVDIAGLVDPKFRLQPRHLLLAALLAFAGEARGSCAARALSLQHHARRCGLRRLGCGSSQGSRVAHREIPFAIARPAEMPSRCGLASFASLTFPACRLDT